MAGMMGPHEKEWWVLMIRNLHIYKYLIKLSGTLLLAPDKTFKAFDF
jgi:hypothetical protein